MGKGSERKTHEKFMGELKKLNIEVFNNFEVITKYSGGKKNIILKNKYGEVTSTPDNLLMGKIPSIVSALNKTEYWLNMAKEKREDECKIYDYSKFNYVKNSNKSIIICKKHGEFLQSPSKHIFGRGCPKCAFDNASKMYSSNHEEFLKKLKDINPKAFKELEFIDKYIRNDTKLRAKTKYGDVWVAPNKLLNGRLFTIESAVNKTEFIINKFKANRYDEGKIYDYSKVKYKSNQSKIIIICNEHGEFLQSPSNHEKNQGCPLCNKSHAEQIIYTFLNKNNIEFKDEKTFNDCSYKELLRFDFFILNKNIVIEYDGEFHYEDIYGDNSLEYCQIRDKIKNKYCKENNIRLIRIPYWDFDKIEDILIKELDIKIEEKYEK